MPTTRNAIINAGPCTAEDRILTIMERVENLVLINVLNDGQARGLTNKLTSTLEKLEQGNTTAAQDKMQAFIDQINSFINDGVLTVAEGQPLIDAANNFINFINSSLANQ